jgi:hypothetical protein
MRTAVPAARAMGSALLCGSPALGRAARLDQRPDGLEELSQLRHAKRDMAQLQVALKGGGEVRLGMGAGS